MVTQSLKEPLLRLDKVSKHFPGVQALKRIELDIFPGEIHAVLGENGAGKSTLMKILSGVFKKDEGEIFLQGRKLSRENPREALRNGIALVYQELSLIPMLNIAENLFLGRWPLGRVAIDWKKIHAESRKLLERFEINLDPATLVISLSVAEQQMVEILKAISHPDIQILLLDEPTSALSDDETKRLFQILHTVKKENRGIIFISHKINEAMQIADRITVLRDGEKVITQSRDKMTEKEIVFYMTGKNFESIASHSTETTNSKKPVLSLKDFSADNFLKEIRLDFYLGEIVVVFGLIGSGKTSLAKGIMGLIKSQGTITLKGRDIIVRSPREAIDEGIGYIPEDRREGLVFEMPVFANITLAILKSLARKGILNIRKEKKVAGDFIETLRIRTPNIFRWGTLSQWRKPTKSSVSPLDGQKFRYFNYG
ncbi:MAG TPA: sugar ABC transporter ATP-binding protein [Atribacteraceae bacterium]|nr:sugar ABC transporter ATP-binding protein [Atribacteraceae bacterium]